MTTLAFSNTLLERIHAVLKPIGYRKRGHYFSAEQEDVILLVQLQKSMKTTKEMLIATVNLGVFSRTLSERLGLVVDAPTIPDCHWWQRIGSLLPGQDDEWWQVRSDTEARAAGDEIATLLEHHGISALQEVSSSAKLRALWLRGKSPGLTEHQRQRYLRALDG